MVVLPSVTKAIFSTAFCFLFNVVFIDAKNVSEQQIQLFFYLAQTAGVVPTGSMFDFHSMMFPCRGLNGKESRDNSL